MQCAILFAPVEALYLVLDQILTVLCEVPKHHKLVRTERFFRFHVSCLDFCQVWVSSKVVDDVNEEFLVFFESCCKCSQYSTICCLPQTIMEFESISRWLSSSSRNFFKAALFRYDSQWCIINTFLSGSQTTFLIRSLYVYGQSVASTSNTAFWWVLHTQTEWVPDDPARTHHFGLRVQNLENPIFMLGYLSLIVLSSSDTLHRTNRFCLCTFQSILT